VDVLTQLNNALAGRYLIERQIGQGGMAIVYLARDLRHERKVALKVLSPELGAVVGKERFLAEIRVTANLQHPHLLPLFDSGEAEGQLFYVMPYVQGESLRDRLNREKQLPIDEAVRIAAAVGGALDYAHRHGVIHRDLKPENILLQEGQPLVADFGIALAVSVAGGARITQTGLSLGTPQYMSPEQATGDRVIDGRTDIYSLGAVLYEMLTGDPPHTGSTAQAIIAKVITDRPRPVRLSRDTVPRHVEAAVECALAKLPADRFATAQEFIDALRGTRPVAIPAHIATPASTFSDPALRAAGRKRKLFLALPWVLLVFASGAAATLLVKSFAAPRPIRLALNLGDSVRVRNTITGTLAIARDGSRIVVAADSKTGPQLFVRELTDFEAKPISGTERGEYPMLSPDGRDVLFSSEGRIKRVGIEGGTAISISDSGSAFAWGDNDVILITVPGNPGSVYATTANGGALRRIATADTMRGQIAFAFPHLLPGSEAALLTVFRGSVSAVNGYLAVVRLSDGRVIDLDMAGAFPQYADGYVLFSRASGAVFGAPFDVKRLRITGPAVPLLENVIVRGGGSADFVVSQTGTLVYRTGLNVRQLVAVDLRGKETLLVSEPREYSMPRSSPDGKRIAVAIAGSGRQSDTWVFDAQSKVLTRLSLGGSDRPEWSPDGRTVYLVTRDSGVERIVGQPWDAGGAAKTFVSVPHQGTLELSMPRSGKGYFAVRVGAPARDIWIAPIDTPAALRPFIATKAEEMMPSVSPDGKWLAYVSNESGRREVYVRALPGPGGRLQISTDGGMEPLWSPRGGGALFYRGSGKVILAHVVFSANPSVTREALFDDVYSNTPVHAAYDVSPDGATLLFSKAAGGDPKLVVVLNWFTDVRQRFAATRR
jgi:eukaryotic-like serine/threonine-protein kinase